MKKNTTCYDPVGNNFYIHKSMFLFVQDKLAQKYGVSGIPRFVLIDLDNGETIIENARQDVVKNENTVETFPWKH